MRTWQRFRALDAADRGLIVEGAAWLFFVRIGISTLPFLTLRRVLSSLSARSARRPGDSRDSARRVAWAVTSAARHLPLPTTCLIESLAAQTMLRRRGVDCELRLGVKRPADRSSIAAHAWIVHEGAVVIGRVDDLYDYAELR